MKYFKNIKPTIGSRFVEAGAPIVSDEERLRSMLESHKVMAKDKALGTLFSPLSSSRVKELVQQTSRNI